MKCEFDKNLDSAKIHHWEEAWRTREKSMEDYA